MKILLGSHGKLASGMKTSLGILIGENDASKVTVIDAYVDGRNIDKELEDYFNGVAEDETILMLSDLYGGSVNQKMYLYLQRPNTYLVAGVNLAFVLEVCMKDDITKEEIKEVLDNSRQMQRLVELDLESSIDDDDDFL